MSAAFDIVIVGAGHAGLALIDRLRAGQYSGSIALIGDEPHAPYQRPPLSKEFLQGRMSLDELSLGFDLVSDFVTFFSGASVVEIDRNNTRLRLADGGTIGFGQLALTTGSRPRRLPAPDDVDILYLSSLADCLTLRERLPHVSHAVIIGGGFVGLEVAATLQTLGRSATIVETQDRLLARSATPALSAYVAALHRAHGVGLRLGEAVERIEQGRVLLSGGTTLSADMIIAGIGSLANDALARAAGLTCDNGVLTDEFARTSDPHIVAAGDCTLHPNVYASASPFRLESIQNAMDQAATAADTLMGKATSYSALPTFWSDQYDARIAIAGISQGADDVVVRGDPAAHGFSTFAFRNRRLIAVESINRAKDQRVARKLVSTQDLTPDQARDESVDLTGLVKQRPAR